VEERLILEDKRRIYVKMLTDLTCIKFLNKEVLANGYIRCIDINLNIYYIAPECLKEPRIKWVGVISGKEIFVYCKNDDYEEENVEYLT
jgi:hypothetical protein